MQVVFPKLLPVQQIIENSDARFKVVAAGRRSGKTRYGVIKVTQTALQGGNAWWVAPTYKVARIGWRQLVSVARQIPGAEVKLGDYEILMPGGGRVGVRSDDRDTTGALRGDSLDYVVLDEAAYISEVAWKEALRPALADRQGGAMFISTPKGYNWFYDLFEDAGTRKNWERFHYPTSANPIIPQSELDEALLELGSHVFSQEFEARFVELGGNIFKSEWLQYWEPIEQELNHHNSLRDAESDGDADSPAVPTHVRLMGDARRIVDLRGCVRFLVCDPALSTKQTADYTAMGVFAMTSNRELILLEMIKARMEAPDILKKATEMLRKWNAAVMYFEKVAFQASLIQSGLRQGLPIKPLTPDKDKMSRALALTAPMEAGRVWFPPAVQRGASDVDRELLVFPDGDHDDQVDVMSYAARLLLDVPAGAPKRSAAALAAARTPNIRG